MPAFLHDPEFWVLIAAALAVAVVWKPAKRSLIGGLDARAQRIRSELDEARNLREEAQRMLAEYQRRQRDATGESQGIVEHARAEAERIAGEGARALELALERRRRLAEERIAQAQAAAVAEIRALAVDIAIAAAREVILEQLDERGGAALIDGAIAALPQQLQ
jgi:F-type H+-transporting ATPase subunit b